MVSLGNFQNNKKVKDIHPGDKGIDIIIILIEYLNKTTIKNGSHITQYLVGDDTGCIQCNFYDDIGDIVQEGDILFLSGAYASIFKQHLILYTAKYGLGKIIKLNEFFMTFSKIPNLSKEVYANDNKDEHDKNNYNKERYNK